MTHIVTQGVVNLIKAGDFVEDLLKFKGFWKASLKDKVKWLIAWVFIALFISLDLFLMLVTELILTVKRLFKRK